MWCGKAGEEQKGWEVGAGDPLRSGLLLALFLGMALSAFGQEGAHGKTAMQKFPEAGAVNRDLFFNPGGRILLPGFREYDQYAQERSDSIMVLNSLRVDVDISGDAAEDRSVLFDARLAAFNMQFGIGGAGGDVSLPAMLARFLLQQALQFGYQYARERVRAQSLSEMDYLSLPQGPGMIRDFNEVGFEARLRGEAQSSRVWRDYLESRKNSISPQE
ncbi:MAG: hypothetical protein IH600_07175 [Bacteroidetes bacterium]|nr:hypothetical protein [Bacteroidota bacterium]